MAGVRVRGTWPGRPCSGKIIWSYGHPGRPGSGVGYLHEPDYAYLLKSGQVTVADSVNCRVLVINQNGTVAHQIATNGVCVHHPPASLGSPNGDTPLPGGNESAALSDTLVGA
jgi:hypothetical protein